MFLACCWRSYWFGSLLFSRMKPGDRIATVRVGHQQQVIRVIPSLFSWGSCCRIPSNMPSTLAEMGARSIGPTAGWRTWSCRRTKQCGFAAADSPPRTPRSTEVQLDQLGWMQPWVACRNCGHDGSDFWMYFDV